MIIKEIHNKNCDCSLFYVHAEDGKMLTDGDTITEGIYFSKNNPIDDWWEIDVEEEDFEIF